MAVSLPPGAGDIGHVLASALTDDDGRFELALSEGGPRRVRTNSNRRKAWQDIDLTPGTMEWNVQLDLGTLVFKHRPSAETNELWGYAYRRTTPEGLVRSNHSLAPEFRASTDDPWVVVVEVAVTPGQVTTVELP